MIIKNKKKKKKKKKGKEGPRGEESKLKLRMMPSNCSIKETNKCSNRYKEVNLNHQFIINAEHQSKVNEGKI